jgi:hypothetical protein
MFSKSLIVTCPCCEGKLLESLEIERLPHNYQVRIVQVEKLDRKEEDSVRC